MKHASIMKRLLVITILIFFVIICVGFFVVLPSVKRTRELQKHVQQTQVSLEQDYQKTIQLRRSVRELDAVYKQAQTYAQTTINSGDELNVITELESLASRYGVEQTLHVTFTDPKAVPAGERKSLPTKLKLPYYTFSFLNHGTFEQHMHFLEALEHLPYYLIIDSIQLEQRSGDTDRVTLRFDARVYTTEE